LEETPPKKITVYVRAPDDDTRTLSFKRIPEYPDRDAITKGGFAVDGNSLVMAVAAHWDEDEKKMVSLYEALAYEQEVLLLLLGNLGYEVEFD